MKTKFILFIFCFYILSSAYSQKVISLNSLFTEQDAILMPEIEGLWKITDLDLTISFQKAGDNFYHFKYHDKNSASKFEAVLVKIKGELFLDLRGILSDTLGDTDYRDTFLSCHSIYKVRINNDTLILSSLNYSWFYNYAVKNKLPLRYEWANNAMLLTYTTNEFKSFLSEHINEDGIFNPDTLIIERDHFLTEKDTIQDNFTSIPKISLSQKCIPKFPFKEGWLGGDGDVSVPINDTTTLFIFSDTYVGNINQKSRQEAGMNMVSNTVAVATCLPNGETDMKYFWNNMYSDNPEPIFKTHTNRYRYWVLGAFMIKNNLYVVLNKVGNKPGAPPDEIFNFSLLGFSLAKISNPYDAPDEWNIELSPLNDFKNPLMGLGPHVVLEDYIYFFVSRDDKAQILVRKQLDFIDKTEKPFEYFALDKTWKEGLNTNDMDTIVNGFRSTTVNYHPEMKQWVMISDVLFMDNKIKMRTAPALTGPWSDEIVIYEIPEVTPGNSSYSKSNFCYLAREHIQYYDSINHVMLLTYDINNSDFSEILSSPKIYTPKIITIPMKKNGSR